MIRSSYAAALLLLISFICRVNAVLDHHNQNARLPHHRRSDRPAATRQFLSACPAPVDIPVNATKPNPFAKFTQADIDAIVAWLEAPARGLNLTNMSSPKLTQSDNYIWLVEELKPNKTDVLAYLDRNATAPPSYARVVINEGGKAIPDVTEYYVGPLPISPSTKVGTLNYMYNGVNGPRILFNGRFPDRARSDAMEPIVIKTMSAIADITLDLVGFAYYGRSDNRTNGTYFPSGPTSTDGSTGIIWTALRRAGLATFDQPSDLYVSYDVGGTDPSLYKMRMILYNMVLYHSIDEFRQAWSQGKIVKSPRPTSHTEFLRKDRKGPIRELEDRLAPTVVELEGKRYKVDKKNRYVEYLGWSFYTRFDRDVGIQFYDIKFKGERILYELSLQDAVAQYAGHNPFQAGTAWSDRFWGIGSSMGRLVPGYDCPYHATYLSETFSDSAKIRTANNSICIFETDLGTPVTRHSDPAYLHSTKGSKLTVRVIATVANYDYLWDYTFWVDGTIGVDAHASGYVQANYYRPDDKGKWGPRIQETISGTLHTHVMNFKADFDLGGTANTFVKTDIVVENITQPWFPERGTFEMMRYNITELQTEDEGLLPVPANGQSKYTIVNKNLKNKWGEPRGYRIVPGLSNVHLASQNSPFFIKSAQFAKQAFAVSRQHDTEPGSATTLNQNVPSAPMVEFRKFFNSEPLVQQDLVAWVNLGMHHYTRAEDIPNTLMSEAHSSITFAPHNWGDAELTVDLTNAVIYDKDKGKVRRRDTNYDYMYEGSGPADGSIEPETNGVNPPVCFPLREDDQLQGIFVPISWPGA